MDLAYAAADLVVSRAGAMTCSEILATGKPSILVLTCLAWCMSLIILVFLTLRGCLMIDQHLMSEVDHLMLVKNDINPKYKV